MDLLLIVTLLITIGFGFVAIKSDFKERKVSNKITFSLFIIAFGLFLASLTKYVWFDFIIIFLTILGSYYVYKKDLWGAADGKIFAAISLLLFSYGSSTYILNFIVNLLIFYLITITLVTLIRTKKKQKIEIIKKIDLLEESLIILFAFVFVRLIFLFLNIDVTNVYLLLLVFVGILVVLNLVKKELRKYLDSAHDDFELIFTFVLFAVLIFLNKSFNFIFLFVIVLGIKLTVNLISNLSEKAGKTKKKYYSPFTLYLFIAGLFTLITGNSILLIIIRLFI
jgi:Flp pilus assembly protein protease CpaA